MPRKTIKIQPSSQMAEWLKEKGDKSGIKPYATIVNSLLSRLRKINDNPDVLKVLDTEGGSFMDFVEKSVNESLKKRGY